MKKTAGRTSLAAGGGKGTSEERKDGKIIGQGVRFERIRRITGYLVGTLDRFNDGKRAEERDRVKHVRMESFKAK